MGRRADQQRHQHGGDHTAGGRPGRTREPALQRLRHQRAQRPIEHAS
jgi:hypothetical protein